MFIVLNMMITFFIYFQETYNNRLRERYGDDTLTHLEFDPDLWMEVGSSDGPDKNRVYGLSNTTADNLRSTRSVSTIGSSQSISSSQCKEFVALQQHTAQLTEKYDNLQVEYWCTTKSVSCTTKSVTKSGIWATQSVSSTTKSGVWSGSWTIKSGLWTASRNDYEHVK
jgi:hypothetical protein